LILDIEPTCSLFFRQFFRILYFFRQYFGLSPFSPVPHHMLRNVSLNEDAEHSAEADAAFVLKVWQTRFVAKAKHDCK
jgi:hypothetical protein